MAKTKIGKIPVYKGEYDNNTIYNRLNQVTYLGTTFQSIVDDNLGHPPAEKSEDGGEILYINTNYWDIIAKGIDNIEERTATNNSMGYKILKKNKSFAEQVIEENTIYEIRYDFTLTGDVTIPANCVLQFEGGSISGEYTIIGNNTDIEAGLVKIFNIDVILSGVWNIVESYPEWFGAVGNGINDDTQSTQKALDFASIAKGKLKFNNKKYCINSINICHPIEIKGTNNKNGYGIYDNNENFNTTIIPTSITLPCFNLNFEQVTSGIVIHDIKFEHTISDVSELPYVISDENSISFSSGIIIENISIPKAYNGIKLHHCERFTIRDINADCANNFLNVNNIRDVSILENIHIWNFSKIDSFYTFKTNLNSDYAIILSNVDEVFVKNIFIYERHKGIKLKNAWINLSEITFDRVNKIFDINSTGTMGVNIENVHALSGNLKPENFNAIEIYNDRDNSSPESCIKIKNIDYRVDTASPEKIFNINTNQKVIIDTATLGLFNVSGIHIEAVQYCSISNIIFAYEDIIGKNTYNGYGIVNNESNNYVSINNVNYSKVEGKLYDGFLDNVIFDFCNSLKEVVPWQNGGNTTSDGIIINATQNILLGMYSYLGVNDININGNIGVVYKVTNKLNANPIGLIYNSDIGEQRIYINQEVTEKRRVAICKFKATTNISPVRFVFIAEGAFIIYNTFISNNKNLSIPDFNKKQLYKLEALGVYNSYRKKGEFCEYNNGLYIVKTEGITDNSFTNNIVKIADI